MVNTAAYLYTYRGDIRYKRKIYMETLIKIFLYLLFLGKIIGQSYQVTILGYHTTDINQTIHDSGRIEFRTQNRGLADIIWPMSNYYNTLYDVETYALKEWSKNIKQGTFKNKNNCMVDSEGDLLYNNHDPINLSKPVHTIFTLIAAVQTGFSDDLDTKWFNFEHEGQLGRGRFIWADSSMAWNGNDSVLCDHYRLDLDITDTLKKIEGSKDYFMKNIIDDRFVRELWVSKNIEKHIVLARVHTPWISLTARINSHKEN